MSNDEMHIPEHRLADESERAFRAAFMREHGREPRPSEIATELDGLTLTAEEAEAYDAKITAFRRRVLPELEGWDEAKKRAAQAGFPTRPN